MSSSLARKFALFVAPYQSGVLPTAVTSWTPFKGVNDFKYDIPATIQDVSDFDSQGFGGSEKTMVTWSVTAQARRPFNAGIYDPGQEIVRATRPLFGDATRCFAQWYDRFGGPEAYAGVVIPNWTQAKSGVADVDMIQVVLNGDGQLYPISNPYQATLVPTITAVLPANQNSGKAVAIEGSSFTGATGVTIGGTAASSFSVISDGLIEAVLPTASAGSAPGVVTNAAGSSAAFAYTRGA